MNMHPQPDYKRKNLVHRALFSKKGDIISTAPTESVGGWEDGMGWIGVR